MANETKIHIVVETSANTKALESYKAQLEESVGAARIAGLSTKGLEKELSGVNHQLSASKLSDYRAALVKAGDAARKAGQDTGDLDRQLKALDAATPTTQVHKLWSAFKEAGSQIPGVSAFTKFFNGSGRQIAAWAGLILSVGVGALAALWSGMTRIISTGVSFNSTLEDSQLGIAAVLKQFDDTGKFANFDAAMEASAGAIDLLKQKALESPASFEQLVQAYQGTAGAMAASGMDIQQQVNTIVTMSQTLAGLGITSGQILQETRAILTGNITEDAAAARILGITREMIATAKEEGQLYEFLQQRMAAFAEAGVRSSDTLTTKVSNLGDSFQQLSGQLSKPFFESLKNSADEAQKALNAVQRAVDFFAPPPQAAAQGVSEIATNAREAEQEVRKLNNARVDALKQSAESAGKAFDDMAGKIRAAAQEADDLDASETARALAQVDLDEQKALAAAGTDPAAQESARADASARRRAIQAAREARRSTRSQEAEQQIAAEIESQIAARAAETMAAANEAERARQQAQAADAAARKAGVWPEFQMKEGNEAAFMKGLAEDIAAAEEQLAKVEARWRGIADLSEGNRQMSAQEVGGATEELSRLKAMQDAAKALLEARAYQQTAEGNEKAAADAMEQYKDTAEPKLNQANANLAKLQIEEETAKIKEQAEAARAAADAKKTADTQRIADLEKEKQLQAEKNDSEMAQLRAMGATEEAQREARIDAQEKIRAIELEIAGIRGESERVAALQEEDRLQESLAGTRPDAPAGSGPRGSTSGQSSVASPGTPGAAAAPEGPGGRRVRGAVTSDSFEQSSGVGAGDAARPQTNFQDALRPRGFGTEGTPEGPPPAAGGPRPPAADSQGGQGVSEAGTKNSEAIKSLEKESVAALEKTAEAVDAAKAAITRAFKNLEQRVKGLEDGL